MYLFYDDHIAGVQPGHTHQLNEEESAHAVRVLRHTVGDIVHIADGQGCMYEAVITNPHPKHCEVEIRSIEQQTKHHKGEVHIAVAPTKNIERMEWLCEKCTEIGVDTLTPLLCHYSERKQIRTDRLGKIILSAAKQSLSAYLPHLNELTPFEQCVLSADEMYKFIAHSSPWTDKRDLRTELRLIAAQSQHCLATASVCVLIGPEGGFSNDEVRLAMQHGFIPVSLGDARLRTETAAIVACAYLSALIADC